MDSFIPCKYDFRMKVNSKDSIELIRGPIGGQHECKISCQKVSNSWNINVDLFGEDSFDVTIIHESGFPLEAINDLMETFFTISCIIEPPLFYTS